MCGVSPAAITKAIKQTSLGSTVVGRMIDANHPIAVEYRENARGIRKPTNSPIKRGYETQERQERKKSPRKSKKPTIKAKPKPKIPEKPIKKPIEKPKIEPKEVEKKAPKARKEPAKPAKQQPKPEPEATKKEIPKQTKPEQLQIPDNILEYQDLSLRQVLEKFGTATRFTQYLDSVAKIEVIHEKRVKHAAQTGELISRDLVKIGIIEPLNTAHRRLLTDAASTIASEVFEMARAEFSVEQCEIFVKDQTSSILEPMKDAMRKAIEDVK